MTAPTLLSTPEPAVEFTTELLPGHVVDLFGSQFRVSHFRADRGPLVGAELAPARRVAIAVDGRELTILPGQAVPVLVPTAVYELRVFAGHTPDEPFEVVRIAAESEAVAETVTRRVLVLSDCGWADVYSATGEYVATVAVSPR